jgi:hypothetical protein
VGGRARSRGGVDQVALTRRTSQCAPVRGAGHVSDDEQSRHLAPILHGAFGRRPHKSSAAPKPGEPRGLLLLMFPPDGSSRVVGSSSPGAAAGRDVAVLTGGAVTPAPPDPHTQGSGGSLQVGRREDPQAASGRLVWGERVANPAPLSKQDPMTRRNK